MAKVLLIGESGDTVRYAQAEVDGVPVVGSVDLDSGFTGPALVSEVCRQWEGPGGSKWWVPVHGPRAEVGAVGLAQAFGAVVLSVCLGRVVGVG